MSSILYRKKSLDDEPSVFLDPNELSADGTVALTNFDFSGDAKLVAYSFSRFGTDWKKIKIRDVESGKDYPEILEGIWLPALGVPAASWTSDNKGFFYNVNCRLNLRNINEYFNEKSD